MKLDFDQLKQLALKFNQDYREDGDLCANMDKGVHVYGIQFEPQTGRAHVHLQWPHFRNQVANEADHPATYTKQLTGCEAWLHLMCTTHGVEISTCVSKHDVINELKALELHADYEICEDDDILALFILWQNMTGWDQNWSEEVVVCD